jgi:hypothetical protein
MVAVCMNGSLQIVFTEFLWEQVTCCGRLHAGHFHYMSGLQHFHKAPLFQGVYSEQMY